MLEHGHNKCVILKKTWLYYTDFRVYRGLQAVDLSIQPNAFQVDNLFWGYLMEISAYFYKKRYNMTL